MNPGKGLKENNILANQKIHEKLKLEFGKLRKYLKIINSLANEEMIEKLDL